MQCEVDQDTRKPYVLPHLKIGAHLYPSQPIDRLDACPLTCDIVKSSISRACIPNWPNTYRLHNQATIYRRHWILNHSTPPTQRAVYHVPAFPRSHLTRSFRSQHLNPTTAWSIYHNSTHDRKHEQMQPL